MKRLFSPPVSRLITILLLVAIISLVAYGRLVFPDAPIRPCVEGFCGKTGELYPESSYRQYILWDQALLWAWVAALCYWIAGWLARIFSKR